MDKISRPGTTVLFQLMCHNDWQIIQVQISSYEPGVKSRCLEKFVYLHVVMTLQYSFTVSSPVFEVRREPNWFACLRFLLESCERLPCFACLCVLHLLQASQELKHNRHLSSIYRTAGQSGSRTSRWVSVDEGLVCSCCILCWVSWPPF